MSQDELFGVLEVSRCFRNSKAKDASGDSKNLESFLRSLTAIERNECPSLSMEEGRVGRGRGTTKPYMSYISWEVSNSSHSKGISAGPTTEKGLASTAGAC